MPKRKAGWMKKIAEIYNIKIVRFIAVGATLYFIDIFTSLLGYYVIGISAGFSSALGFTASFFVGYLLNRKFVFRHDELDRFSTRTQILLYLLLSVFNLLLSASIVQIVVSLGMRIEIVKTIVIIIFAFWNYTIFNKFIFANKVKSENRE